MKVIQVGILSLPLPLQKAILLRRGARTYPEADRKVGAEPAARLGSTVRGRPTTFVAQMIEIGGMSWGVLGEC